MKQIFNEYQKRTTDFVRQKRSLICIIIGLTCVVLIVACDESLPPRNDPTVLFKGSSKVNYSLQFYENVLRIEIDFVNIYDETIQAKAVLEGTFLLELNRLPTYKKTIHLTSANLITSKHYNLFKNEVTINPGDTMRFSYVWDFIGDNNVNMKEDVFTYYLDQTCFGRYLAYNETFSLTGSMKILEKAASTSIPLKTISLCYVQKYYSPHECSAPPTPCLKR